MPPFLMMILVAFAVLMVVFGHNPLAEWRAEQAKYGKDPLVRQINKYNEKSTKNGPVVMTGKYKPPSGSTVVQQPAYPYAPANSGLANRAYSSSYKPRATNPDEPVAPPEEVEGLIPSAKPKPTQPVNTTPATTENAPNQGEVVPLVPPFLPKDAQ